ncbi:MAG: flavodoxin [Campylobacter sp.]|uniref:flavodoxin n=1 Tax=unclassified Campylobacter TaxID=2593542 RepID=UPI0022E99A66|nr:MULTISPECIES: flavodoxin [unclassified Campylobacter]MBQ3674328.1 flavodoxin [Campylobacter sp.]MBQ7676364.1 flavodoxin [Campylobacter sp.]MBQ9876260.1 flavodoxin [Campylobacter sp.]MDA3056835.1 flavodoxin [Campylobacter sp. CN_NA1]MDA3066155.1 flavodoxin [Campylobacter sp. CN_NE4]
MKKILIFFVMIFFGCAGNAADTKVSQSFNMSDKKILIAYFSRADENYQVGYIEKGNTEILAEFLAEFSGGKLFKIETLKPYAKGYQEAIDYAKSEQKRSARPEIKPFGDDIANYDAIFLGFPTWWGDLPMGVFTFLESVNLQGKPIFVFNTHEGSGLDRTVNSVEKTTKNKVLGYFSIRGAVAQNEREKAKKELKAWFDKINN